MAKKYIDADILKKEIEELEGLEYPCDNSEQNVGFENALDRVSDIIDSLQQQQSCDTCTNDKGCVTCKDGELWEGKEQPSEDLEEEIHRWVYNPMLELTDKQERGEEPITTYISEIEDTARHFAEWQKEQMPKWKKNGGLLRFAILEDENGRYVQHEGYKIYFNDLLKLLKED